MRVGLDGRVIVVTGAASGIGRAVAQAASEAGAVLFLTDRNAVGHVADLADPAAAEGIMAAALAAHGRIDGLVNAAGVTTRASVVGGSLEDWDRLFAVNARAPFFLMQRAVRDMVSRGAGGGDRQHPVDERALRDARARDLCRDQGGHADADEERRAARIWPTGSASTASTSAGR